MRVSQTTDQTILLVGVFVDVLIKNKYSPKWWPTSYSLRTIWRSVDLGKIRWVQARKLSECCTN